MAKFALDETVPGPSPWYFGPNQPKIANHHWDRAGESDKQAGKIYLSNKEGPVLLIDMYSYVLPVGKSRLLLWHQARDEHEANQPLVLTMLDLAKLTPLKGTIARLCGSMKGPWLFSGQPLAVAEIPTSECGKNLEFDFPAAFGALKELLMLCQSTGTKSKSGGRLALMVARPSHSKFDLHPQRWFNEGQYDFAYEWPTRVARDPKTKRIHGDGIRIGDFTLDASLEKLA